MSLTSNDIARSSQGGVLFVANQQSLAFEGAGGDGAQQTLKFRLGRGGTMVEAGPFPFERVDAIHEQRV